MTIHPRARAPIARALCAALALAPAAASAQSFVASEHDLQYRRFIESDVGVISGRGAVQIDVAPTVDLQFDGLIGSIYRNAESENHIGALMVHGVYDTGMGADAGAFLGREFTEGEDRTTLGVEGRFDMHGSEIQPWISYSTGERGIRTLGLAASSDMAAGLGLDGSIVYNDFEEGGPNVTSVRFTASYELPIGAETFASAGYTHVSAGEDRRVPGLGDGGEASLALGMRFELGRARGTTFGSRSLFEFLR